MVATVARQIGIAFPQPIARFVARAIAPALRAYVNKPSTAKTGMSDPSLWILPHCLNSWRSWKEAFYRARERQVPSQLSPATVRISEGVLREYVKRRGAAAATETTYSVDDIDINDDLPEAFKNSRSAH